MAVITLVGNTIGCCIGTGSFEGVGIAFSSAKQSIKSLTQGISTLKSKIDTARVAADVDTSHTQAQNAEKREETKQGALTTGYDKLETLISDVGTVDNKSADKIRERKNDFYAQYSYLKPECEKSMREKAKEKWNKFKSWCQDHVVGILTAVAVILVAAVAAVFLGPAFVAAICAAIALACTAGDLIAMAVTGKDIYTFLKDRDHPILAEIFGGLQWGSSIASVALSFVDLGGQIIKVGLKGFLTGGEKGIANIFKFHAKNIFNGIKADFKAIFGKGLGIKNRLKAVINIFVFNQSGDFSLSGSVTSYRTSLRINTIKAKPGGKSKYVVWEGDQLKAKDKSDFQNFLNNNYPDDNGTVKLTDGKVIEFDPKHYSSNGEPVGKANLIEIYSQNKSKMFDANGKVILSEGQKRDLIWGNANLGDAPKGFTHHEPYSIFNGKIQIYDVPSMINNNYIGHKGGIFSATKLWEDLASGSFLSNERKTFRRNMIDLLFDFSLQPIQ